MVFFGGVHSNPSKRHGHELDCGVVSWGALRKWTLDPDSETQVPHLWSKGHNRIRLRCHTTTYTCLEIKPDAFFFSELVFWLLFVCNRHTCMYIGQRKTWMSFFASFHLIPLRQGLSANLNTRFLARLEAIKPQWPSYLPLLPPTHHYQVLTGVTGMWDHIQLLTGMRGSERRSSWLYSNLSDPLVHLSSPMPGSFYVLHI